MISWPEDVDIYLHRDPVDFRKAINGLCLIVQEQMELSPFDQALFVFCNKTRDKLKVLYWDQTGFVLWHKRLEKAKFKWPRKNATPVLTLTYEQWGWLLRGFDLAAMKPHHALYFPNVG